MANLPHLLTDTGPFITLAAADALDYLLIPQINSADAVYQRAEDAGRAATRRRALTEEHEAAMTAITSILQVAKAQP